MSADVIFITNMENHDIGLEQSLAELKEKELLSVEMAVYYVKDTEIWGNKWKNILSNAKFILFTWMGTGLSCEFLKKAAEFMRNNKKQHFFHIMDPGNDILQYGIEKNDELAIKQYFSYGGLINFKNLCLWLVNRFCEQKTEYEKPVQFPWNGIYCPQAEKRFLSLAEYQENYWQEDKVTIGFIFSREDYLWDHLEYENVVINALHNYGCNVVAVFTTTLADKETGAVNLSTTFNQYFYIDNKCIIDVLINPFSFSLTRTGFLQLADIQKLHVPVLQVCNIYKDFKWWEKNKIGLTSNEISYAVAMPEFDGVIHGTIISTNEENSNGTHFRKPILSRIDMLARKAKKWALLKYKENKGKKIAIIFHNYPPTNSNIGSAACLDSIESVRLLLEKMQQCGYTVADIPKTAKEFIGQITEHATNDRRFMSETLLQEADGKLRKADYEEFFAHLPSATQKQLEDDWQKPPGDVFVYKDDIIVPGMLNGNIFITVQPPRGFGDDPAKIYHSPDCAPTHHYLGFYYWLRDIWQADAMIHVGTHGNLEWLPGKGNAMSDSCYPDIATGDMPNIYPYWITCVGEGIQAKRRSAACLISYLSAPMSISGTYEEMAELEKVLEEYCHFKSDEDEKQYLDTIKNMIRSKAAECNLVEDVPEEAAEDFDDYVGKLHIYITDIKNMQISTGLHILGIVPQKEELQEYILALTKLDNDKIPSLVKTLAKMHGFDYYDLLDHSSKMLPDKSQTYGMLLDTIRNESTSVIEVLAKHKFSLSHIEQVFSLAWTRNLKENLRADFMEVIKYICCHIAPSLQQTVLEQDNLIAALSGEYIDPSPSGAPTSGGADLLPTGRNFYSIDPRALPTQAAWAIGSQMAENVIKKFITEEGHYPESVGIILWATSNLRNHGQCIAEFLSLMGLKPVWQSGNLRVMGFEIISLTKLKRPRVDVTGRISGLFRDSLPASVTWLDDAVQAVAKLDEPVEMNFIRKHVLQECDELIENGMSDEKAWRQASFRIFGDPPGAHGAGIGNVLEAKNWENIDDIAEVYTRWGAYAYGEGAEGDYLPQRFKQRMSQIDITIQNIDHRESSMLSGDDYNNYRGGMIAAVRSYRKGMPRNYVNDSSDKAKLQIRSLNEELKRWFRGEAMNPKYIEGMKKHGYKGAGDLATYVAVSYQWDTTSEIMDDWMYEKYAEKYAFDKEMQEWMRKVNPWALHRITEVLLEADQRGLWQAKPSTKKKLQELFLSIEGDLEEKNG